MCVGVRTKCKSVHVVPGTSGSCALIVQGRKQARRGTWLACIITCGLYHNICLGKAPLGSCLSLPVLPEAADENRGIGTEQTWVLILPCFLLVWGKPFSCLSLYSFICIMGEPAQLPGLKEEPKRGNSCIS